VWLAIAAAAISIVISVSYVLFEKDMWQHIAVGRALWSLHAVPTTQIWIWPTYGLPDVTPSWLFRVLLWPVWEHGGVVGLFAWRWVTTLAAFGLAWATARRLGARGLTPLVVIAVCALTYRQRSQLRPETLVAVLLALQIWILESRRQGGRDLTWTLVPIAWVWANAHISYPLGFALTGIHLLEALRTRKESKGAARRLALVLAGQIAISFLHPGGLPALAQPFVYLFAQRNEPIMRTIPELKPVSFRDNLTDLLPLVLLAWLLLFARRARRRELDWVELLTVGGALALALPSQRFLGFAMVMLAPWLARDLDAWVAQGPWPSWTRPAWARAGLVTLACAATGVAEWARPDLALGIAVRMREVPVYALNWAEAHEIRGRVYNPFYFGGYFLYRFWPDRERLPFMDIHQSGTAIDRYEYVFAAWDKRAFADLNRRNRFEWIVWRRVNYGSERTLDLFDADTSLALVFVDDAAAIYLPRRGRYAALVDSFAYRAIPAGPSRWRTLGPQATRDASLRARIVAELEREVAESPEHATAKTRLGAEALALHRYDQARAHLEEALRVNPRATRVHERLALVALAEGDPRQAVREVGLERRVSDPSAALDVIEGKAWRRLGNAGRARACFRRALDRDAGGARGGRFAACDGGGLGTAARSV
jgi:tetratricopeptide (TPR) repeat protein